jgi:hypothetical protein
MYRDKVVAAAARAKAPQEQRDSGRLGINLSRAARRVRPSERAGESSPPPPPTTMMSLAARLASASRTLTLAWGTLQGKHTHLHTRQRMANCVPDNCLPLAGAARRAGFRGLPATRTNGHSTTNGGGIALAAADEDGRRRRRRQQREIRVPAAAGKQTRQPGSFRAQQVAAAAGRAR